MTRVQTTDGLYWVTTASLADIENAVREGQFIPAMPLSVAGKERWISAVHIVWVDEEPDE